MKKKPLHYGTLLSSPGGFTELKRWMIANDFLSHRKFAEYAFVNHVALYRLLKGQTRNCPELLIARISRATYGAIGPKQFLAYEERIAKTKWRAPHVSKNINPSSRAQQAWATRRANRELGRR